MVMVLRMHQLHAYSLLFGTLQMIIVTWYATIVLAGRSTLVLSGCAVCHASLSVPCGVHHEVVWAGASGHRPAVAQRARADQAEVGATSVVHRARIVEIKLPERVHVWSLTQLFSIPFVKKPCRGNAIPLRSSQRLRCLGFGPLKGFLS